MDSGQIIAEFRQAFKVPVDAVREAERQAGGTLIPLLTDIIAHAAKAPLEEVTDQEGLVFMAFHLLRIMAGDVGVPCGRRSAGLGQ